VATSYVDSIKGASKKTPKGRTVTIQLYVYPDGHGNFIAGEANLPVADSEEATGLFEAAWEELRS
jgi:hypothetical protein